MWVTEWGASGLLCAINLAQRGGATGAVGADKITENKSFNLQYSRPGLHLLKEGEIVESVRDRKGGYHLIRPETETTLYQISVAAEGDAPESIRGRPLLHPSAETHGQCASKQEGWHYLWVELKKAMSTILSQKTLAEKAPLLVAPDLVSIGVIS